MPVCPDGRAFGSVNETGQALCTGSWDSLLKVRYTHHPPLHRCAEHARRRCR